MATKDYPAKPKGKAAAAPAKEPARDAARDETQTVDEPPKETTTAPPREAGPRRELPATLRNSGVKILVMDEPGSGGANHQYRLEWARKEQAVIAVEVKFQKGDPKAEQNGVNNEDLLAIVLDRLQAFQKGEFACRENALAITNLEQALLWLNYRTAQRIARGVEGQQKA